MAEIPSPGSIMEAADWPSTFEVHTYPLPSIGCNLTSSLWGGSCSEQLSVDSFRVYLRRISERAARRASNIVCNHFDSFLWFFFAHCTSDSCWLEMFQSNVSLPFGSLGRSDTPQPGLRSLWRVQRKRVLRWEVLHCLLTVVLWSTGLLEATLLAF